MHIGKSPYVNLPSENLFDECVNFMIDTGSDLNFIKKSIVKKEVKVDSQMIFELSGITKDRIRTIDVINIRIFNNDILFHVSS